MGPAKRSSEHPSVCSGKTQSRLSRRFLLGGLTTAFSLRSLHARAHERVGPVKPPIQVPNLAVVSSEGVRASIRDLLFGKVTAIQLMFSKCKSICPIEAGTLARVEEALADYRADDIQLLSLSIDPITDTPEVLKAWLERFGARRRWNAASPAEADLARVRVFFDRVSNVGEIHSTAIHLVDRNGFLVWRTFDLPDANEVARLLLGLHRGDQRPRPELMTNDKF
jgi:protein SCO1/2